MPFKDINKIEFWQRNKLPIILQSEGAECGLAALAMVANYFGYKISLLSMRQKFNLSLGGATLHDIVRFSETLELTSRPLRIELEDLKNMRTPCILHWDLNHFVVLKSANSKSIIIHDPAIGERHMNIAEVSKHFTGILLELTPTKNFKKKEAIPTLKFSDFWSKITGLTKSLTLFFTLSLLLQIFVLVSPYYMQLVIDDVILSGDVSLLSVLASAFFLVLLFEISTSILRGLALLHFGNLMNIQLGVNLFHHLIRLPMEYFEKRHMGDVVSRFGSLQYIRQLITTGITETIIDGIMAIITIVLMFLYSVKLTIVVLIAVSIYALLRIIMFRPLRVISEQEIKAKAEESSYFMETIRGIQTIKLFVSEAKREGQWQNHYINAMNHNIRLGNYQLSFSVFNRFIFGLENIIVIYLAAHLVIQGGFSTGMLFAFFAYKLQFMDRMANLIEKLIQFKMLGLHLERLADIAYTDKEQLQNNSLFKHNIKGKIAIKNLSFQYSDTTPIVINNLNLQIKAGESVAITGPSGCGKSTLLKLMLGLAKPQQGKILIDNISLEHLGHENYRQQIAAVMQNDELLSGTVTENITFFDATIDMEYVIYCAKLTAIHSDISKMPMGYDSLIGDMGSSLSGGQKQRIILARALYKKPKILFMDEATSHLDSKLEFNISEAIKHLKITRIIIAHRKETIDSAEREIKL